MRHLFSGIGKTRPYATLGRTLAPADRVLLRVTGGTIGVGTTVGLRTLLLTTVGNRSGLTRQVPLVFLRHGNGFVVIGSNWGGAEHPAWTANLLSNPEATVTATARTVEVRGRLLSGEERERAWKDIAAYWPAYDSYATRAENREIRVFLLEPR